MVQNAASPKAVLLARALPFVTLVEGDLQNLVSLIKAIEIAQPDEVYNLGALSSVSRSWSQPELTAEITGLGPLRLLEALRAHRLMDRVRFYQASSSEMFGATVESPQNERTRFRPIHPYAVAKVFAHCATVSYREVYGLFAVAGILFNHESPRRGEEFVTRKISRAAARIALGLEDHVTLGNLDVRRDWGYAPEYVQAMWMMLQQPEPRDYVIATGQSHTIRELAEVAFQYAGIDAWERHVRKDSSLLRPADVLDLCGDSSKARNELGWMPRTGFQRLIGIMVDSDMEREKNAALSTLGRRLR
jgi:GDPmannose 4,6-dehydratase